MCARCSMVLLVSDRVCLHVPMCVCVVWAFRWHEQELGVIICFVYTACQLLSVVIAARRQFQGCKRKLKDVAESTRVGECIEHSYGERDGCCPKRGGRE